MAKSKKESSKKAPEKTKKGIKVVTRSHRENAEGTWTDAPEDPPVVNAKDAVIVESVVIHRPFGKKEKRPHFMADIKI